MLTISRALRRRRSGLGRRPALESSWRQRPRRSLRRRPRCACLAAITCMLALWGLPHPYVASRSRRPGSARWLSFQATLKDAPKVEAVKPQTQAQEQAAPAKQQQDGAETKPSASRLDELKRQVTGGASAGRSGASPSASAAAGKSLVETIEAGLEQGIEAAEAAVAGAASVLTGGALGASGSGAPREGDGGGGSSLSAEQAAKVKEMKARLGLVSQSRHHSRKAGA